MLDLFFLSVFRLKFQQKHIIKIKNFLLNNMLLNLE